MPNKSDIPHNDYRKAKWRDTMKNFKDRPLNFGSVLYHTVSYSMFGLVYHLACEHTHGVRAQLRPSCCEIFNPFHPPPSTTVLEKRQHCCVPLRFFMFIQACLLHAVCLM